MIKKVIWHPSKYYWIKRNIDRVTSYCPSLATSGDKFKDNEITPLLLL